MYSILPSQSNTGIKTILLPTRRDITDCNLNIANNTLYETITSSERQSGPVKIRVLMVGIASSPGSTAYDGARPAAASGESALFEGYLPNGFDALELTQWGHSIPNTDTNGAYLNLAIKSGTIVNLRVGSARGSSGYGNNGAPYSFSTNTTLPSNFSLTAYGAKRCSESTNSYSDSTSYAPDGLASYGSASNIPLSFMIGSASVTAYFNKGSSHTLETGAIINGTKYGNAIQYQYGVSPNNGLRSPEYAGCALIEVTPLSKKMLKKAPTRLPYSTRLVY